MSAVLPVLGVLAAAGLAFGAYVVGLAVRAKSPVNRETLWLSAASVLISATALLVSVLTAGGRA